MAGEGDTELPKLSYSFARAAGVLARMDKGEAVLTARDTTSLDALLEARRIIDRPARLDRISGAEFEALISQTYAQGDLSETAET